MYPNFSENRKPVSGRPLQWPEPPAYSGQKNPMDSMNGLLYELLRQFLSGPYGQRPAEYSNPFEDPTTLYRHWVPTQNPVMPDLPWGSGVPTPGPKHPYAP